MGEPITVGGGGGIIRTLADYAIELRFDDTKFVQNADGDYVYAGYKIDKLLIQDFLGTTTILDCRALLPDDRQCTIVFRFKHSPERIYILNKPITIRFDDGLWATAGAGSKLWTRQTQHDGIGVDLGRGKWNKFDLATPRADFKIQVEAELI